MLDQPVPNPLAKNPNFYTHKVFAAVGLILIGTIIAAAGIWYFVQGAQDKVSTIDGNLTNKSETNSAKNSTNSADKVDVSSKKATEAAHPKNEVKEEWKTFTSTKWGFEVKYPSDFNGDIKDTETGAIITSTPFAKPIGIFADVNFYFSDDATRTTLFDRIKSYEVNKVVEVDSTVAGYKTKDLYTRLPNGKVGNIETIRYKVDVAYGANNAYNVLFVKNGKIYLVNSHFGTTVDKKIDLIDTMLTTFKFL